MLWRSCGMAGSFVGSARGACSRGTARDVQGRVRVQGVRPTRVHDAGSPRSSKRAKVNLYVKSQFPVACARALLFLASSGLVGDEPRLREKPPGGVLSRPLSSHSTLRPVLVGSEWLYRF